MKNETAIRAISVDPHFVAFDRSATGEPIPSDIINARIVAFGTPANCNLGELSLVIDYLPADSQVVKRLVLSFDEGGMGISALIEQGLQNYRGSQP